MEVIATYPDTKKFVNRGFLIGPYCPIYGYCSIAMILLLNSIKSNILLFLLCIIVCSIGEYATSYIMEKMFHARWWDYTKHKFNLNGRICLSNCLAFGILGFLLIKFINPFFFEIYSSLTIKTINILFYTLITIFIIDSIISFNTIFKIKNLSIKYKNLDNTSEIKDKIKKMFYKNYFSKRIFKASPEFHKEIRKIFEDFIQKIENK
jgi:uncharacterized membrane protein